MAAPPSPVALAPLLARLRGWRPAIVGVEALSGVQCDALRRQPTRYRETVDTYCFDPSAADRALGLDEPAAAAVADRLIAHWPQRPTAAQRRHLAAVFLAAGEPGSALVQWFRLPLPERRTGDGLDAVLVATLVARAARANEIDRIAAPLAAELGLERLVAIDDHSADAPSPDEAAEQAAVAQAWRNPVAEARRRREEALAAGLTTGPGALAAFRAWNDPSYPAAVWGSDFGAALAHAGVGGGRYVGWWHTRNLRMAANITEAVAATPGARTLVIVGASHKGTLDTLLGTAPDLQVADALQVLR